MGAWGDYGDPGCTWLAARITREAHGTKIGMVWALDAGGVSGKALCANTGRGREWGGLDEEGVYYGSVERPQGQRVRRPCVMCVDAGGRQVAGLDVGSAKM